MEGDQANEFLQHAGFKDRSQALSRLEAFRGSMRTVDWVCEGGNEWSS